MRVVRCKSVIAHVPVRHPVMPTCSIPNRCRSVTCLVIWTARGCAKLEFKYAAKHDIFGPTPCSHDPIAVAHNSCCRAWFILKCLDSPYPPS